MNEKEVIEFLKSFKEDNNFGGSIPIALDMAIHALTNQEMIIRLLKCHDDFDFSTSQLNYELVKAIRNILNISTN